MLKENKTSLVPLYIVIISLIALATGMSDAILSNFFKDAYNVTAQQRGFIEFPRELPGILASFAIASLARLGDIRITLVSQCLSCIGILTLGLTTPQFYVMTAILFVFSLGQHIYMPLTDSIAMSISEGDNIGTVLGKFKGISTIFTLLASVIVFVGFKTAFFSFTSDPKLVFVLAAILFFIAVLLLAELSKRAKNQNRIPDRPKLIIRKQYKFYYILAVMNGVAKANCSGLLPLGHH